MSCIKTGSKDTACATQQNVVQDCDNIAQAPRTCSMESGHAECVDVSEDCNQGDYMDENGKCAQCSAIETPVNADTTDCETCPNVDVVATAISGGSSERGSFCIPKVSCEQGKFKRI